MLLFVRFRKDCLGDFMTVSADCHRRVTGHLHRRATVRQEQSQTLRSAAPGRGLGEASQQDSVPSQWPATSLWPARAGVGRPAGARRIRDRRGRARRDGAGLVLRAPEDHACQEGPAVQVPEGEMSGDGATSHPSR